ncbi:MAG: arylsulfatase [Neisseria sp.]|nr:arylsulfatase [Neisseria sp.]
MAQIKKTLAFTGGVLAAASAVAQTPKQPNIVVIMADDMGWSDIGAYGSEISTPNIDALAEQGIKFTNFQVSPYSSPSRAMFLTGTDPHRAGLGGLYELNTPDQAASPNYAGRLNPQSITVAQRLQQAGYYTVASGKWHLGKREQDAPSSWGFDRSFVLLNGEANHFRHDDEQASPDGRDVYRENGKTAEMPFNVYSSDFYTDYLIRQLDGKPAGKPLFAYLAFTAPHSPLQAPEADIAKYRDFYHEGPQHLAARRVQNINHLQLFEKTVAVPQLAGVKKWADLSEEERIGETRRMQIYAAMIDNMDQNIGRLKNELQKRGELDNTVFLFLADNGAAGASREKSKKWGGWIANMRDNSLSNMGKGSSYVSTGAAWAQASNAPFALFKGFTAEGSVRSPLIVSGKGIGKGIDRSFRNMADLMPTLLDIAGADLVTPEGKNAPDGRSFAVSLSKPQAATQGAQTPYALEMRGGRQVQLGRFKARYLSRQPMGLPSETLAVGRWQLFDVIDDPAESRDLAAQYPEKLAELVAHYRDYAKRVGTVELDSPDLPQ